MIQYFEGILFLTSNRMEDFDEAFQSRIHLTIRLPEMGPNERAQVWKGLVALNKRVMQGSSWTEDIFAILGQLDINVPAPFLIIEWRLTHSVEQGKRIKNILRMASCYARAKNTKATLYSPYLLRAL
jgi:hypothetical protein